MSTNSKPNGARTFLSACFPAGLWRTKMSALLPAVGLSVFCFLLSTLPVRAVTFTNNASLQISDPTSSLTCTGNAFTISCWFRISIPSSLTLSANMNILTDRTLITGEAGQVYDVQRSTNLADWTTEATVTNITGTVPYSTNIPPGTMQLYYRARVAQ